MLRKQNPDPRRRVTVDERIEFVTAIYDRDEHHVTTVAFPRKWMAVLFHMLLHRSTTGHSGSAYG